MKITSSRLSTKLVSRFTPDFWRRALQAPDDGFDNRVDQEPAVAQHIARSGDEKRDETMDRDPDGLEESLVDCARSLLRQGIVRAA
jgi:hypothetical protein